MKNPGLNLFPGPKFLENISVRQILMLNQASIRGAHHEFFIFLQYSNWCITSWWSKSTDGGI